MMDFARRLAPVRDSESTRAVAAMHSRFESDGRVHGPLALANPVEAVGPVAQALSQPGARLVRAEAAATPPRSQAGPVRDPMDLPRTRPAAEPLHAPLAAPVSVAHSELPLVSSRQPALVPRGLREEAALPRPMQLPSQQAQWHTAPSVPAAAQPHPGPVPAAAPPHAAGPVRAAAVAATDTSPDRLPLGATPHRPLSEAAVASRVSTAPAPRPVVRVSIDRIEVRAPAAKPAPAPAPRARAAAPSVSLADYLRQGDAARGGRP